jgi:hypothetical protein
VAGPPPEEKFSGGGFFVVSQRKEAGGELMWLDALVIAVTGFSVVCLTLIILSLSVKLRLNAIF